MTPTSASSPALAASASPLKPVACAQLSFASGTPTGSATSPTIGPECPSSGMSTTLTPLSAQLWPTARVCSAMAAEITDLRAADPFPNLEVVIARHTHSFSPPACLASQPVPPASDSAREMTAGSGRRLSAWLNASDPAGACLKTLLDSPRWHSPLRSLAWTLKGYGGVPDEPCAKSSAPLTFWDMTSRETGMASLGFRLCRLSQSELSTDAIGFSSSPDAEMWPTSTTRDWKGSYTQEAMTRKDGKTRDDLLPTVAEMHNGTQPERPAELWATPRSNASTGAGEHGDGAANIQTQAAYQTGQPPTSSAEPTASRGQLNPDFVCWLMGYPAGWLNYADSATPSSRKSPRKSSPP